MLMTILSQLLQLPACAIKPMIFLQARESGDSRDLNVDRLSVRRRLSRLDGLYLLLRRQKTTGVLAVVLPVEE